MTLRRFPAALLLTLSVLALTACEQPAVDPDQPVRDLLMGSTWVADDTGSVMVFYPGGSATLQGGSRQGTWSYQGGTFTLTHNGSGTMVTEQTTAPDFAVSATSLTINYLGSPRLFEALP